MHSNILQKCTTIFKRSVFSYFNRQIFLAFMLLYNVFVLDSIHASVVEYCSVPISAQGLVGPIIFMDFKDTVPLADLPLTIIFSVLAQGSSQKVQ